MLDLHTHIFPAVDDGAGSVDEALEMLAYAKASGTDGVVLTPHYLNPDSRSAHIGKEELFDRFLDFKDIVSESLPDMKLYLGAETFAVDSMRRMIDEDRLITLNGSRYILLEFGFEDSFYRALDIVSDLTDNGFIPIIAHPERYSFLQDSRVDVKAFLKSGALLQVNSSSLGRRVHGRVRELAVRLLREQLACAVASDCHDVLYRTPDMTDAYEAVSLGCSKRYAQKVFLENQTAILNDADIR